MSTLVLAAPITGWIGSLDEAPDEVFAGRMMGDGVAIDPTESVLAAPCDGEVIVVHRAKHAVTLRAENGAEILMHIGIDTVALGGAGFDLHVAEGQKVKKGDRLISFDLEVVAEGARSLQTPILITNGDDFTIQRRFDNRMLKIGEPLMELLAVAKTATISVVTSSDVVRRDIVIPLAHGIHARPAARISDLAKSFKADIALVAGNKRANAKSPIALLGLGLINGDTATLESSGTDAAAALEAVAALIASGMGESEAAPVAAAKSAVPLSTAGSSARPGIVKGVRAAPGVAIGIAFPVTKTEIEVAENGQGQAHESDALADAIVRVKARLASAAGNGGARAAIMGAHLAFLEDPDLHDSSTALIGQGKSAGFAWRHAIRQQVDVLRKLSDPRLVERVADLLDLEGQVLTVLVGGDHEAAHVLPEGAIILADEMLPSELAALDATKIAGICTARGGPTSHVAILASSMGIPAVVAAGSHVMEIASGTRLILDADLAELNFVPDAAAIASTEAIIQRRQKLRAEAKATAHELCKTADGVRIEVAANLGSLADAKAAVAAGAEGSGLLRTEFLFMDRQSAPDEDEQYRVYQSIADVLDGRPLVIRTLDVGGDKPASYLPIPHEENPALGLRGVRVSLWRPDLLRDQLRAILRVKPVGQARIMVPMIANIDEIRAVRAVFDEERKNLGITAPIELGIMVETPAAAMIADILGEVADFMSIGTNDLTQYTLSMDRGNPLIAAGVDGMHPSVLRLIAQTTAGAAKRGRWTGVCGGLASDLSAVPILIGLGVTELSATTGLVPDVKALVRRLTMDDCRRIAAEALQQESAAAVRKRVAELLPPDA